MAQQPKRLDPEASPQAFFGAQLRAWRTQRAMSQVRLGQLVHISGDLVSKLEKAERRAAPELAAILDAALDAGGNLIESADSARITERRASTPGVDLVGEEYCNETGAFSQQGLTRPRPSTEIMALLATVAGCPAPFIGKNRSSPPSLDSLSRGLTTVWKDYQGSRFYSAAASVSRFITAAQFATKAATTGDEIHRLHRLLAEGYHVAAATASKLNAHDTAWVCADRGLTAAELTDDPTVIASLLRSVAHVQLSMGRLDIASNLLSQAIDRLEGRLQRSPLEWSLLGSLNLVAAMAAARGGNAAEAQSALSTADSAAEHLGVDANHAWTAFGPTNVSVHRLSVAVETGDLATARALAQQQINARLLPGERRIRHQLEVAKVLALTDQNDDALKLVMTAEREAPEQVRHHRITVQLVTTWQNKPFGSKSMVGGLAQRVLAA